MDTLDVRLGSSSSHGCHGLLVQVGTDLLHAGRGICFQATGRSMYPAIRDGEKITVRPVNPSEIKRGDIILYRSRQGMIAHRTIKVKRVQRDASAFILRGDALGSGDESVEARRVLGKVVWVEREGRRIAVDSRRARILHVARVWAIRVKSCSARLNRD